MKIRSKISDEMDEKQMKPPEGMALVYLIRSAKFGYKSKLKVFRNGQLLGRTKGLIFIPEILDPGTYTYISRGGGARRF